jgi:hypothetical protein
MRTKYADVVASADICAELNARAAATSA